MFGKVYRRGDAWWVRYRVDGKDVRLSVATALGLPPSEVTERDATKLLQRKVAEAFDGRHIGAAEMRVTVGEVIDQYLDTLRLLGRKSWKTAVRVAHGPREEFGSLRAVHLTTPMMKRYLQRRLDTGLKPATVMLDVWVLSAAYHMAHEENRLTVLPVFPSLTIRNARKGFVEPEQFEQILGKLGSQIYRDVATFAYVAARRINEVLRLPWTWVDRSSAEIRWPDSKNDDPVALPLDAELSAIMDRRWKDRAVGQWLSPWVFHLNQRGPLSATAFRGRWAVATAAAGYPGLTPHDMRRSGVRNLIRGGVTETVAMSISGHRSTSVFRRYNITSPEDKARALGQVAEYRRSRTRSGTLMAHPAPAAANREERRALPEHHAQ
jgi:integrase